MFEVTAKANQQVDIRLYGTVSEWGKVNVNDFSKAIDQAKKTGASKVKLRIHSPGGSIFEGLAIASVLQSSGLETTAVIEGLAASMGSVLATSTDHTGMVEGTRMMIHQGAGGIYGSAGQIKNYANLLEALNNDLAEHYAQKTGKDKQWILDNWMAEGKDTWFTAQEALKAGLIDKVIPKKGKKANAEASFEEMVAFYDQELLNNETKNTMNREQLIAQLGLEANATDEQITTAIDNLKKNQKTPGATGEDTTPKTVEAFMKLGRKSGLINDKNEASYKALAGKDLSACLDLLPDAASNEANSESNPSEARLSDIIIEAMKGTGQNEAKTWEQMTPTEKAALEEKDPDKFKALFDAAFGNVENGES